MLQFKEQRGYFTFVQNSDTTDYLRLAYAQALSIKATQKLNKYAIAVDQKTKEKVTDKHRKVIDYIIDIPGEDDAKNESWKLSNEWKAQIATPFRETIKLDCDMLFPRDISHWWHGMQQQEICITTEVRSYRNEVATNRTYRKVFDANGLLNAYSGFTYFRYSRLSTQFFQIVETIMKDWDRYRDQLLKECRIEQPTTDEVYALAAKIVGEERCHNPTLSYPSFIHMKPAIQNWDPGIIWPNVVPFTLLPNLELVVGGYAQRYPFHYVDKDFITDELIERYETKLDV